MCIKMDGKALADKICFDLKHRCNMLKERDIFPNLTIVTSGDDAASKVYVRNKIKRCEEIGITVDIRNFEYLDKTDCSELLFYCQNPIIIQEPITGDTDHKYVSSKIFPVFDVDGFSVSNMGKLFMGEESYYTPCTPTGVMELLNEYEIPIRGKTALVIGRSNIVGRPMAAMLEHAGATVTVAHSGTNEVDLRNYFFDADIVVSAVGKRGIIGETSFYDNYFMNNKTIVDIGMNRDENGKLCGDFSERFKQMARAYTPTPGGTGPMTVAMLMSNVIRYYENYFCRGV